MSHGEGALELEIMGLKTNIAEPGAPLVTWRSECNFNFQINSNLKDSKKYNFQQQKRLNKYWFPILLL